VSCNDDDDDDDDICCRHSGTQSLKERMMDKCLAAQTSGSVWASFLIRLTMTTSTITPISWLS
jgi:hypothetical protein